MDWLYRLWKSEIVKLFTVTYNGLIEELSNNDWKFLTKMSQTCKISKNSDHRILEKNKVNIYYNILKILRFTTEEINIIYNSYIKNKEKSTNFEKYLRRKGCTNRESIYGNIMYGITYNVMINDALSCSLENIDTHIVFYGVVLGIFERNEVSSGSQILSIRFSDKYNIAKYFPGYIRNKEMWDYLKTRWLNRSNFYGVITGNYTYDLIKKQSTIFDYE